MTPDQVLRRWVTRARRALVGPGADHAPTVLVEGADAPARPARQPRGTRVGRALRFAAGFTVTLSVIGIGFAILSARLAQIHPDWSVTAEPAAGASYALAAGDATLRLLAAEDAYRDGFFLAPERRRVRLAAFQAGAASSVAAFATVLDERRRRSDPDLAAIAAELGGLDFADEEAFGALISGRDALHRFADRVEDGRARYDPSADVLLGLAQATQTAALANTAELAARVRSNESLRLSADAEASFYRARGEAYGWRLLLSAYGRDMPASVRARVEPALSDLVAATEDAADYQPLFLLNGAQQSAAVPNHLAHLAVKLTQVSAAAERLARDLRTQPPA